MCFVPDKIGKQSHDQMRSETRTFLSDFFADQKLNKTFVIDENVVGKNYHEIFDGRQK